MTVRLRYQTIEFGEIDIHVRTLRDNQQFEDIDQVAENLGISSAIWPIFGVVWPSSCELAQYMSNYDVENKRILEVGCGIGLASLLLNHLQADITATDIHPSAQEFLNNNSELNNDRDIPFERMDWNSNQSTLGKFDLIIGSDLLYEAEHARLLSEFIEQHANDACEVIIIDPKRGLQGKFVNLMRSLGYTHQAPDPERIEAFDDTFKHRLIRLFRDD